MFVGVLVVLQCLSLVQVHGTFCLFKWSPEQLRVALRGPNGVTVSWRTSGILGSNDTPDPQVEYSTNSALVGSVLSPIGTTTNYNKESFFHNVALLNLAPGTTYYYRILATTKCVTQSAIRSFTTPPASGSSNPVNIAFLADLGNDNWINGGGASRTIKALTDVAPQVDFFVHNGDISYADDYGLLLPPELYEPAWNKFQSNLEPITSKKFYMTGPGNHEVTCFQLGDSFCQNSDVRNFSAYLNRYRMPGDESGGYKNLWYSFDYGSVHVVMINTETDFPDAPSGPGTSLNGGNFQGLTGQLTWLANDLNNANNNRAQVPWIIVAGHRPFYSSLPQLLALPGNCTACGNAFIPLILQYNVDLYIAGHVHWYERLYPIDANGNPVANDYSQSQGFIHITNGAAGAPEGAAKVQTAIPASAKIVTGFGYVKLQIQDASNARLSFFSSDTNQEEDVVNIYRQR